MHITHRLSVVLALLAIIVPASVSLPAAASFQERWETREQLDNVLDRAAVSYASGRGLPFQLLEYEEQKKITAKELMSVARDKREVRLERARVRDELAQLDERYGIVKNTGTGGTAQQVEEHTSALERFTHIIGVRSLLVAAEGSVPQQFLFSTLGEITESDVRLKLSARVLYAFARVSALQREAQTLEQEHEELIAEYWETQDRYDSAARGVLQTAERIRAVKRTVEEVHAQVIALQSELARIDARLRAKVERELIEKGLRSAEARTHAAARGTRPQFAAPAFGRYTAGFQDSSYAQFFGVPHQAVDIAIPQGSAVFSAADGIVFLARDGGQTGYSYVLIGHRDGYATLYGHLSEIQVSPGQDVSIGEQIGFSGGTPGTYGAGPMTTGAHLHFEMIHNGTHIDPLSIIGR